MRLRYPVMLLGLLPAFVASASDAASPDLTTATGTTTAAIVQNPSTTSAPDQAAQPAGTADAQAAAPASATTLDPRHVDCLAKVILHEAGNQSRRGKIAVAQVIRARLNDPRFPKTVCAVISQPGQFFNVDAYRLSRETPQWREAVEIATDTLSGHGDELVPGALFFHAAGSGMPGRRRLAQIEGHVFYR